MAIVSKQTRSLTAAGSRVVSSMPGAAGSTLGLPPVAHVRAHRVSLIGASSILLLAIAAPAQAGDGRLQDLDRVLSKYSATVQAHTGNAAAGVGNDHGHDPNCSDRSHDHGAGGAAASAKQTLEAAAAALKAKLQADAAAVKAKLEAKSNKAVAVGEQLKALHDQHAAAVAEALPAALQGIVDHVHSPSAGVGGGQGGAGEALAQIGAALGNVLSPGKEQSGNPVRDAVTTTVSTLVDGVGALVKDSGIGPGVDHLVDALAPIVDGVGVAIGTTVTQVTGSAALGETVVDTVTALTGGLKEATGQLAAGEVVETVKSVVATVGSTAGTLVVGVGETAAGVTGSASGVTGITNAVGGLLSGVTGGANSAVGQLVGAPAQPVAVPNTGGSAGGLVVGSGGVVGTVGQVLGPTLASVLGNGSGFVSNGSLHVNAANITQAYSTVSVAGLPVVNLSPVGKALDGLGGLATGSRSHLTLIGGVTSDSYLYNINNGNPNGLLGLLLPDRAPAWASSCVDVLGLVKVECWGVMAAQDYQVLIGEGAYANGSKEVVIGSNARHQLAAQDAASVFAGGSSGAQGVPTADYDARQGHSVIVGDSAVGTANAQTLLGAGATSNKANSVALGYKSDASRGGMDNYTAFGLSGTQTSIGEVSVGSAGRQRQITNVAAGTQAYDAVNLGQLQGALSLIGQVSSTSLGYVTGSNGVVDYTRVLLGSGYAPQGTVLGNLGNGVIGSGSTEAINGGQLHSALAAMAGWLGGGSAVSGAGVLSAPSYTLYQVGQDGTIERTTVGSVGAALDSISGSLSRLAANASNGGSVSGGNGSGVGTGTGNGNGTGGGSGNIPSVGGGVGGALPGTGVVDGGAGNGSGGTGGIGGALPGTGIVDGGAGNGSGNGSGGNGAPVVGGVDGMVALAVRYTTDAGGQVRNEVMLGADGTGAAVAVRNVAAGQVGVGSTDAVNGGQLASAQSALAGALGAGAGVAAGSGQWQAPSYAVTAVGANGAVGREVVDNVGDALSALDGSLGDLRQRVQNIQEGGAGSAFASVNSAKPASVADGLDSLAAGPSARASAAQSVAIGDGANAFATGAVALGAGSIGDRADAVSVGAQGSERQVVHVADGTDETDAVNVRQLQAVKESSVGYGVNEDGSVDYGSLVLGRAQTAAVVHNVAQGVAASDAVNVSQLNSRVAEAIDWSRAYTDQRFDGISREVRRVDSRASAGIAMAMAMAGLPQPTDPGKRMAAVAGSTFHGESGMAVGVSGVSEGGRWIYKLSGSTNTRGDGGVTVGAGFQW